MNDIGCGIRIVAYGANLRYTYAQIHVQYTELGTYRNLFSSNLVRTLAPSTEKCTYRNLYSSNLRWGLAQSVLTVSVDYAVLYFVQA